MSVLIALSLTLVGLVGTAVVGTEIPERQAVSLSVFGLALTVLFVVLQAPDAALSQLGIGSVAVPLMVMLAVRRIRRDQDSRDQDSRDQDSRGRDSGGRAGRDRAGGSQARRDRAPGARYGRRDRGGAGG